MARKKKDNNGVYIMVGIIIAAFIIAPNLNFEFFSTFNTDTQDALNNQAAGDCSATLDRSVVNVGDFVAGTVTDGANTLCEVYATDGSSWRKIAEGTTDNSGNLRFSENIMIPGTFTFRVLCGTCITNEVNLVVNPIVDDSWEDGDVIDTEVVSGIADAWDEEQISIVLEGWTTGGPYLLGARIHRSWDFVEQCDLPQEFPVTWTLWDSNGMAWQKYDYTPTSVAEEICPLTYHEDAPWTFKMENDMDCAINYEFKVDTYICGVLD